jgi:hypothetical protein
MEAQASKRDNPFLAVAGIAIACIVVILLCAVAIAAIMEWIPVSEGAGAALQTADAAAKLAAQGPAHNPIQAPEKHSVLTANPGPGPEQAAGRSNND